MRLFTAVELGDEVRARAAGVLAELQRRVERTAPGAKITWVPPDRLHLTLRFIGEVDDTQGERIIGVLRDRIPITPFVVRWRGLGAFPRKGPPRVLWSGVGEGGESLQQVEAAIGGRLLGLGIPGEERPYSPHLTLARVREAAGLRTPALFDGVDADLGATRVDAITLFQSKLSPKGPTYTVLQRTPLRDS